MKFHKDSLNGFQFIGRTRLRHNFVIDKVPREITQKVYTQELWFLHSALMLIDICMKFHKDSLNAGFRNFEIFRFQTVLEIVRPFYFYENILLSVRKIILFIYSTKLNFVRPLSFEIFLLFGPKIHKF